MKRWNIEFFETHDGKRPVEAWLDSLPAEARGKLLARLDLLAEHGPALDFPYTSQVEGRLRELRMRLGKSRYRVLYFFDDARSGVLLHGLTKNTEKLEEAAKRTGILRMLEHRARSEKRKGKAEPEHGKHR